MCPRMGDRSVRKASAWALEVIQPQDIETIKMIKEALKKEESEDARSDIKRALKAIEG